MRIVCHEQYTVDWFNWHLGRCTGSGTAKFADKLERKSKYGVAGDWSGAHWDYVRAKAWEKINGVPHDNYVSEEMDIGRQYEPDARIEFAERMGVKVIQTGFILHPTMDFLGASPDGYIIENEICIPLEIKVPKLKTHERYLEDQIVPEDYVPQMDTQSLCMDRAPYGYFCSFCPPDVCETMPDEFRLFVARRDSNAAEWERIELAAIATMKHVVERMEKLRNLYPKRDLRL